MLTRDQVKTIISNLGITQTKLASEAGLTRQTICSWLKGRMWIAPERQEKISEFLENNVIIKF